MKKDDLIASIMGVLHVGKENAISFKQLANRSNLGVGRLVHALRFANKEFCIIKDESGYYLPEDTKEGTEDAKRFYFNVVNNKKDGVKKFKGTRDYIIDKENLF